MWSKAAYPLDLFQSIIHSSTTKKSESLSVGRLFQWYHGFPAYGTAEVLTDEIKSWKQNMKHVRKHTTSHLQSFISKGSLRANRIIEGQNRSENIILQLQLWHSSLAWPNHAMAVVKDPVDSQGHVLAQRDFECFQTFCQVQGFVCWSSLSLKILFDYREGPTLNGLKYKLIVNTKRA